MEWRLGKPTWETISSIIWVSSDRFYLFKEKIKGTAFDQSVDPSNEDEKTEALSSCLDEIEGEESA